MNKAQNKKFKVWWDEKDHILCSETAGDFSEQDAREAVDEIMRGANEQNGKIPVMNDVRAAGRADAKALKVLTDLAKSEKFTKKAFVVRPGISSALAPFIIKMAGVDNAGFFKNKDEAVKWLKE